MTWLLKLLGYPKSIYIRHLEGYLKLAANDNETNNSFKYHFNELPKHPLCNRFLSEFTWQENMLFSFSFKR